MSVRSSILAVLTLGPAYGLQIHTEIEVRTNQVGAINVGQVYSTLARLCTAQLVVPAGETTDGLPLYALTPDGAREAERWLVEPEPSASATGWSDMVNQVSLAASIHGPLVTSLVAGHRAEWASALDATAAPLAASARSELTRAAHAWLDEVDRQARTGSLIPRPLGTERPRRGRKPSQPA